LKDEQPNSSHLGQPATVTDWLSDLLRMWHEAYPRMDIYCPPGTVVMFDGRGGYDGEQEDARATLTMRGLYEVERIDIGGCSSTVSLVGVKGRFNTVLFAQGPNAPGSADTDRPRSDHPLRIAGASGAPISDKEIQRIAGSDELTGDAILSFAGRLLADRGEEIAELRRQLDERGGVVELQRLRIAELERLYTTVNDLMTYMGYHGEAFAGGDRARAVMDALHAIDGGIAGVPPSDEEQSKWEHYPMEGIGMVRRRKGTV
jgi:hypothetical protein